MISMPKLTLEGKTKIISILCQSVRRCNRWPDSENLLVGNSCREITITIAEIQQKLSSNENLSGYEIEYLARVLWKELIFQEITQNFKINSGKQPKPEFARETNDEDRRRILHCFNLIIENNNNQQQNDSDLIYFLNNEECEAFYLPNGSFRTCQRFLQAATNQSQSFQTVNYLVKIVNYLARSLRIDIVDISDLSLFEYQQKDFHLKCIRPIREQSLQELRNILSNYNDLTIIGSIQQYYLEQSGWKTQRRQKQNAPLTYLSDSRKNQKGEETTLLRYVAHLIQSTNNDLAEKLTNWLTVKGCFFSQNPQEFDVNEFLRRFTIPLDMNNNSSNPQSFLMISFKKSNNNYKINCWFAAESQSTPRKIHQSTLTNLKTKHRQLVNTVESCLNLIIAEKWLGFNKAIFSMRIELFVDYNLINLDYDTWEFKIGSKKRRLPNIILRLQERQELVQKLNLLNQLTQKNNLNDINSIVEREEITEQNEQWNHKWNQLNNNGGRFEVKNTILGQMPSSYIGLKSWNSLTQDCLKYLINDSLPAAIWCRNQNEQLSRAIIETTINNLLRNDINQLPNELSRIRREANGNPQEVASHLSLLWDPPTRPLPPEPDSENYPLGLF